MLSEVFQEIAQDIDYMGQFHGIGCIRKDKNQLYVQLESNKSEYHKLGVEFGFYNPEGKIYGKYNNFGKPAYYELSRQVVENKKLITKEMFVFPYKLKEIHKFTDTLCLIFQEI